MAGIPYFVPREKLRAAPLNRLVDAANASGPVIEHASATGDYVSAAQFLGVTTLEELQAWNDGIFWFATSIEDSMDYLAIQHAIYTQDIVRLKTGGRYYVNRRIKLLLGQVGQFNGSGARITARIPVEERGPNLVADPTFELVEGVGPWVNTLLQPSNPWVFGGGQAYCIDPPVGSPVPSFAQMGQPITLAKGIYRIEVTAKRHEGASQGYYGQRILGVYFTYNHVGQGAPVWPDPLTKNAELSAEDDTWTKFGFNFVIEPEDGLDLWITIVGFNADFYINLVDVFTLPLNCLFWATSDDSNIRYDSTLITDIAIDGPNNRDPIRAFWCSTLGINDKRLNFRDVFIYGFGGGGIIFGDNTYLNYMEFVNIGSCNPCVGNEAGSRNSGENFRFFGCILFNSPLAINADGGGGWNFFGGSIDYNIQQALLRRGAQVTLLGTHNEFKAPPPMLEYHSPTGYFANDVTLTGYTSGATATIIESNPTHYKLGLSNIVGNFIDGEIITAGDVVARAVGTQRFDTYGIACYDGSIFDYQSSTYLQAGYTHRGIPYFAYLSSSMDTIRLGLAWAYNLDTTTGVWAHGAGKIIGHEHFGPGNSNLPLMMIYNTQNDLLSGGGFITGPNTPTTMVLQHLKVPDGVGMCVAAYALGTPTSRLVTPGQLSVTVDPTVETTPGRASLKCVIDPSYGGPSDNAQVVIFVPVRPHQIVFDEFMWRKPDDVTYKIWGPFTNGAPTAPETIRVSTQDGSSIVTIQDLHIFAGQTYGPLPGWNVTLSGVTGNPGGISNAAFNTTHTIVKNIDLDTIPDYTYTIDLGAGNEATSDATLVGGTSIVATYEETNLPIFNRRFWVNVLHYDEWGRPVLGNDLFAGESTLSVPYDGNDWQKVRMRSWYTEPMEIDLPMEDQIQVGRAPPWATHYAIVLDLWAIPNMNGAFPAFHIGNFFTNGL